MSEFGLLGRKEFGKRRRTFERILITKTINGPSSYKQGGFTVEIKNLFDIDNAIAVIQNDNTLYKLSTSVDKNKITIKVYEIGYDSTNSKLTINEVADGTDLSSLSITIFCLGR